MKIIFAFSLSFMILIQVADAGRVVRYFKCPPAPKIPNAMRTANEKCVVSKRYIRLRSTDTLFRDYCFIILNNNIILETL